MKLPSNIDYTKYHKNDGMNSRFFGKPLWAGLFISILGRYPVIFNSSNEEHVEIKESFKCILESLQFIMPCVFCRKSFQGFLKELPIEKYLVGRIELMYWLYLMKDKVNEKLIKQEQECYKKEKNRLRSLFKQGEMTFEECLFQLQHYKNMEFKTVKTPPFEHVLDYYEKYRAKCMKSLQKCV